MTPESSGWLEDLRTFAAELRPPAAPAESAESVAERTVLGGHLAAWLADVETLLARRREFARDDPRRDAAPAIVLTTSPAGILVAEALLRRPDLPAAGIAAGVACVTEREYRRHCIRRPDEHHRLHVNVWSWIKTRVPRRREAEFARHPLAAGECYWLHRTGIAGAGTADCRDCHLWKWNGRHPALLEAFVRESGVRGAGGSGTGGPAAG